MPNLARRTFDAVWRVVRRCLRREVITPPPSPKPLPPSPPHTQIDNVPLLPQVVESIHGDFKITIVNNTGKDGQAGKDVNVMLYQTIPDSSTCEPCAWKVRNIQYPGRLGPIDLPGKVEFYVIDHASDGERQTGPFQVNFGDEVDVIHNTEDKAPSVQLVDSGKQHVGIKVNNVSGNVQPLEMALFKSGSKIVSLKGVEPALSVYLAIKPAINVAVVEGNVHGQDFVAITQTTKPAEFDLFHGKPNVKIQITQLPSGELAFSEL